MGNKLTDETNDERYFTGLAAAFVRGKLSVSAGLSDEEIIALSRTEGFSAKLAMINRPPGLLLCKTRNRLVAEYALSGITKPMGVAEYQLVRALPEPLDTCLPTIEEIEAELSIPLEIE